MPIANFARIIPLIIGCGVHVIALFLLVVTLFFWANVFRSGSRVTFTWMMIGVHLSLAYMWATRWKDAETKLRADSIEIYGAEPIVGTVVAAFAAAATSMYARFDAFSVGAANVIYSIFFGLGLLLAVFSHHLALSIYWWIVSLCPAALVLGQLAAWTIVPDQQHTAGTKSFRRTGPFTLVLVGLMAFYLIALAMMIFLGTPIMGVLNIDSALYSWLFLCLVSIPMPIGTSIFGLLTYWSDVRGNTLVQPPTNPVVTKSE